MLRHNADPNKIIEERGIAAIHYAAGMDNVNFAEYAMKLILKNEGNHAEMKTIVFKLIHSISEYL